WTIVQSIFLFESFWINLCSVVNSINQWMAHKMNREVVFFLIKFLFKRKNYIHLVHITLNVFDATFLPGPDLWRNIVMRFIAFLPRPFHNSKIEAGIVYKNNNIGIVSFNILFAAFYIFQNCV